MSRILVDCDDVLIDLCSEWIKSLNKIYDTHYTVDDIPDWDFTGMFNADKQELLKPLTEKKLWLKCKDIPDSIIYLKKLFEDGHEIYIVTATDYKNFAWKIEHLINKYFPFIQKENIILCYNKKLINADYLIDDNINNLIGGSYKGLLFSRPHNEKINDELLDANNIHRVNSWKNCYDEITG